jgi:hypothetical protein
MSPEYVRRFVQSNGLVRPPVDAFAKLRERVRWLLRNGAPPHGPSAKVFHGDAVRLPEILQSAGVRSVAAIVTSPPYLGILRYGAFNWIRLWFLGFTQFQIDRLLDGTDSLDVYLSFVSSFLTSAARVIRSDGVVALVIGDVIEAGQHVPLAVRLWEEVGDLVPFELIEISKDDYDAAIQREFGAMRERAEQHRVIGFSCYAGLRAACAVQHVSVPPLSRGRVDPNPVLHIDGAAKGPRAVAWQVPPSLTAVACPHVNSSSTS